MRKKSILKLSLVASVALAAIGCAAPEGLSQKIRTAGVIPITAVQGAMPQNPLSVNANTPGSPAAVDARAKAPHFVARKAAKPYVSGRYIDVQSDQILPSTFLEPMSQRFDDGGRSRVAIGVIAERLSRITGVPVRIAPDVYQGFGVSANRSAQTPTPQVGQAIPLVPASSASPTPALPNSGPLPGSMTPNSMGMSAQTGNSFSQPITEISSIDMKWDGTPAGFLDHITAILNLSWSYRDSVVVIERYMTESFELSSFGGKQTFNMGLTGGNTGTSGSTGSSGQTSSTLNVTETGSIEAVTSIVDTVRQMVSRTGGTVTLNEATARIIVTAPRDVMTRVREVVKSEDAAMSRQVQIQFDIYSVINSELDERGVNWDLLVNTVWSGMIKSPTTLTGATSGQLGINILSGVSGSSTSDRFGKSQLVFNALNQLGESSTYKPITLMAMNRQWSRKTNLLSEGYISETTPATASAAGSGAPGLRTSTISTGDRVLVQPAILDNGTIMLKFGMSLSSLLGITDQTTGSGSTLQKVQTPTVSSADDQQSIKLQAGEAVILTGLSRRFASTDQRTLSESSAVGLGGSRRMQYKREDFLVVVRVTPL